MQKKIILSTKKGHFNQINLIFRSCLAKQYGQKVQDQLKKITNVVLGGRQFETRDTTLFYVD